MGKQFVIVTLVFVVFTQISFSQSISSALPAKVSSSDSFIFYLHGGVVQAQGLPAISSYYGKYEYLAILDSLSLYGIVISEVRPKDSKEEDYAKKVSLQVDSLLRKGVKPHNITLVGASLGAYITLEAAMVIKNAKINFVLIGLCSEYAVGYYEKYQGKLQGNFLSIYEASDSKGPCASLFRSLHPESAFEEVKINMGIDHAFLYKPYDDWVKPMIKWIWTSQAR